MIKDFTILNQEFEFYCPDLTTVIQWLYNPYHTIELGVGLIIIILYRRHRKHKKQRALYYTPQTKE